MHQNEELTFHAQPTTSFPEYLVSGEFIEAVFENWESEFLAVGVLLVLSIFLRQRGSPESKPIGEPNNKTGS